MTCACSLRMPASQRSGSSPLRRRNSPTSGCGSTRKRSSPIARTTSSATSSGSRTRPAAATTRAPRPCSSPISRPAFSSAVFTPIGQRQLTRSPRSPYVSDSHSANATAACFETAYGASPIWLRRPAADAVERKYPSPLSSHFGTSRRAGEDAPPPPPEPLRHEPARREHGRLHVHRDGLVPDVVRRVETGAAAY